MKTSTPKNMVERQDVINECSLILFLNSDRLIRCEEVYDYNNRIFILLELMEGGSMTSLILRQQGKFSEQFVRWTLY